LGDETGLELTAENAEIAEFPTLFTGRGSDERLQTSFSPLSI
jgi:hypothetical protein